MPGPARDRDILQRALRFLCCEARARLVSMSASYKERVARELENYRNVANVHDLPEIYHYWSERYVRPLLGEVGVQSIDLFFAEQVAQRCASHEGSTVRVVSLGSGNGEVEVSLARTVLERGFRNLEVTCVEFNGDMQERALREAHSAGASANMRFVEADLNEWAADGTYDVVLANHSLHHVVALEHLFGEITGALAPDGVLLVNDMIGRNGHMRWPEAQEFVEAIWRNMPDRYKHNQQLARFDPEFVNHDCSTEGFEGVRAQDILPLLLRVFHPETFVAFANVIDVFVDRGYGHNLDPSSAEDRQFIDSVGHLDQLSIDLGIVKPTHLIASFRSTPVAARYPRHWKPEFCVRDPGMQQPGDDLHRRCSDLQAERDQARAQLAAVVSSRTWRYMGPVRALYGRFRSRA
jgi:SAM-dependent methyltransferase